MNFALSIPLVLLTLPLYVKTHFEAKNHKLLDDEFAITAVQMGLVDSQLDKIVTTLREIEDMAKKAMKAERGAVEETKEMKRRQRIEKVAERAAELVETCEKYIAMAKKPTATVTADNFELVQK